MPPAQDVAQWVVSLLKRQAVCGVYFGDRGFFEVLLVDANAAILNCLLYFMARR